MNNKSTFIPVCEPFLNGNELKYVKDCIETGWISSSGKYVKEFEQKFAEYCGVKYGVGVCNGTVALHLALKSMGVTKGDEVIIPSFTMIATAFAVCYTGAIPVIVDADLQTWNIDVNKIEEKITSKTKVILPVSIFGQPCEMEVINNLAKKYNLKVLEDAAESHGAEYNGKKTGALADITAFSFFANKNLTTGEGGIIVTNDENLYKSALYFKNLCFSLDSPRNYIHEDIGFNYRLSNIHAAIGVAQLEKVNEYNKMRIKNAQLYKKYLEGVDGIIFQQILENVTSVHWMNAMVIDKKKYGRSRDDLMIHLKENNIDSRLFFVGMHKQPALIKYGINTASFYPITDYLSENGLYLPSSSNLSEESIALICEKIRLYKI